MIRDIKNGDRAAFRSFVTDTADKGYFLALKILGDSEEARDVLQDAYVKMWEKRETLHEDKSAYPWLSRVIINLCYDLIRRNKRVLSIFEYSDIAPLQNYDNPCHEMDALEMSKVIQILTASLSPKQKIVFILSEIECFSNTEIHESTGISINSVKTNLMLARKKIMALAKNYYAEAKSR